MSYSPGKPRGAARRPAATFWLVWLTYSLAAQTMGPTTGVPTERVAERFLLIVDTSAAMQKRATNTERVVGKLFTDGLGEQLHRGDTIGVWTYTDDLHTGQFPLQLWTPQSREAIAKVIVDFLKQRKYEKKSRLTRVLAQLTNVVAGSDKITVLLISDGADTMIGTPYDVAIAEAYRVNGADQRKKQMPFLTVLRAVKGKFVGFTVNTPPWPVEFPKFPAEPTPRAKGTPVPEAKSTTTTATNSTPRPDPPIVLPLILTASNSTPVTNVLPEASPAGPKISPPALPPISPPAPLPTTALEISNPPAVMPSSVMAANTEPSAPDGLVGANAESNPSRQTWIVVAAFVFIAMVGGVFFWRRSRARPRVSLITRSIDRDPK